MCAQLIGIGQIAIVRQGNAAATHVGEERLDIAQDRGALRGIAGMADGDPSGQALRHVW